MILGACYLLWMLRKVLFGPLREPVPHAAPGETIAVSALSHTVVPPVGAHEIAGLAPLMFLIVAIGVYPQAGSRADEADRWQSIDQDHARRGSAGRREIKTGQYRSVGERSQPACRDREDRQTSEIADRLHPRRPHEGSREAAMNPAYSLSVVKQTASSCCPS